MKLLYFTVLLLLIIVIVCVMMKTEYFLPQGNHSCYPYSSSHQAYKSFKNISKGWCTIGKYGPIPDYDDISAYGKSNLKCPDGYTRAHPLESHGYEDKSWCKKPNKY